MYVLVAIVKKELQVERSLYEILQVLSLTLFEKHRFFRSFRPKSEQGADRNQLRLFDL